MINLLLCVVIFNNKPGDSETIKSLLKINFLKMNLKPVLYIRDNSLEGYNFDEVNKHFLGEVIVAYDGQNLSLSKVYNELIIYPINRDLIIFLDDDSLLDENYFECLHPFINAGCKVAVPLIEYSKKLISPGKTLGVKGVALKVEELRLNSENKSLVAMMSGTAVKSSIFDVDKIKFDENLILYGVDTRFFLDCQQKGKLVYVLSYVLIHDSALRAKNFQAEDMIYRISNLMKAQFYIFDQKKFYKIMLFFYFPVFILGKVVKLKSFSFLKLFKNYKYFWKLDDE
ncbi:MAG: hypothetical protein ACJASR_001678 [Psychroserpens sp.]|jgi:hypothetical protein